MLDSINRNITETNVHLKVVPEITNNDAKISLFEKYFSFESR